MEDFLLCFPHLSRRLPSYQFPEALAKYFHLLNELDRMQTSRQQQNPPLQAFPPLDCKARFLLFFGLRKGGGTLEHDKLSTGHARRRGGQRIILAQGQRSAHRRRPSQRLIFFPPICGGKAVGGKEVDVSVDCWGFVSVMDGGSGGGGGVSREASTLNLWKEMLPPPPRWSECPKCPSGGA